MKTIALFGGSFDPPHIGHEAIVKSLLKLEYIDAVVLMPTFLNPFKSQFHASADLRLKWLKEIFSSYKNVEIQSYEIDQNRPVSSIESVKYLLKTYKKIYLVIGADNLRSLDKWDRYDELKKLVTFIVASRQNITIPQSFIKLDIDVDISSTALREHIDLSKLSQKCALEINKFYKENNAK
ncbi:MAG: nicotinate-nucleotide adenylyltransferase [Sulfurovum sp. FS06-10]|jgi:nicotinate-nucleotide adenylyltransferase|nr:MAG: nicotinate-nucleotide adenylyltransferase [Sulfurovum sp. FS06-10]